MNTAFQSITRVAWPILTKPAPRTFTTLAPLRPSLSPTFRRTTTVFTPPTTTSSAVADVVPTSSITAHPALADMQVRCGPRNTMNGHTRLIQKRRHGFLTRMKSKTGRKILLRRKVKGRRRVGC